MFRWRRRQRRNQGDRDLEEAARTLEEFQELVSSRAGPGCDGLWVHAADELSPGLGRSVEKPVRTVLASDVRVSRATAKSEFMPPRQQR